MRRRFDNDWRAKVFETFEDGAMVTGVKLPRGLPVKLWIVGPGGALGTLTLVPREGGGHEVEFEAAAAGSYFEVGSDADNS